MATITLTNNADNVDNNDDSLYGSANHTWYLLKGKDWLYGGSGRDTVYGFDGADYINGGGGNDTIYGEKGWDNLTGGFGTDTIRGGDGSDYIEDQDGGYDVLYGDAGNDGIWADGDKVVAGDGNDAVHIGFYDDNGGQRADVALGLGTDTLNFYLHDHNGPDYNESRIDVRDFKAVDHLIFGSAHSTYTGEYLDHGQVLDRLDTNNDGWLWLKDVEAQDYDDVTVHVGQNSLTLDVFDTEIVFAGMTKASFDFLA